METFPYDIAGWVWWVISVVVVGFLINIASAYLYPKFEKYLAKKSVERQRILEEKSLAFVSRQSELKAERQKLLELKVDLVLLQLHAVVIIAVSIIGLIIINNLLDTIVAEYILDYLGDDFSIFYFLFVLVTTFVIMIFLLPLFNKIRNTARLIRAATENK
jgi:hypothetical protein